MSKKDEALKMALAAVEKDVRFYKTEKLAAITAIREALAEQPAQQEPYCYTYTENGEEYFAPPTAYVPDDAKPLYTSPPTSKPWVGLTDEQISDLWDGHTVPVFGKTGINPIVFARAIEAKLREKNA